MVIRKRSGGSGDPKKKEEFRCPECRGRRKGTVKWADPEKGVAQVIRYCANKPADHPTDEETIQI